jgi:hypothetical protein
MWPFLFYFYKKKKKKLTLIVPDAKPLVYVEESFLIGRGGVGEATEDDEKKDQVIFHRTFRLVAGLIKVTSTALKDSYFGFSRHSLKGVFFLLWGLFLFLNVFIKRSIGNNKYLYLFFSPTHRFEAILSEPQLFFKSLYIK